jgi:hypothetical protein
LLIVSEACVLFHISLSFAVLCLLFISGDKNSAKRKLTAIWEYVYEIGMRFALFFLLPVLGTTQLSFAQGTDLGTIVGVVTDTTSAVVPNAKVVVLTLTPIHRTRLRRMRRATTSSLNSPRIKS